MIAGPDDTDRRGRLQAVRLGALVRGHLGRELTATPTGFPLGAALVEGDAAWILLVDAPERGLGAALAWSTRQRVARVHVLAERATGLLARRANAFRFPIEVWHVDDRTLLPAVAEPLAQPVAPPADHVELIPTIEAGGARAVVEHGVVVGEVRGLEVCRVTDDPESGAVRLEVGVGVHDREAFALMHGELPTVDALARVVAAVALHRRPDLAQHPLNRLVPERLLRWRLEQEPALVGLDEISAVQPPVPRQNVAERMAASAIGCRADGSAVVVVCSVGVDLDLIPYVADARHAARWSGAPGIDESRDGGVLVVTPVRDQVPVTGELNGMLAQPVTLVALPD